MGYRFDSRRSIKRNVRRIADHQLALAAALAARGDVNTDGAIHAARRHVKKVRSLIGLVRPALGRRYDSVDRRLRAANRLLAPVADGQAVLETLARVARRYANELPRDVAADIHSILVRRAALAHEEAVLNGAPDAVAALLRRTREGVGRWRLHETGFRGIAGGLERTIRKGRRSMAKAMASGRRDDYHAWRRRVKDRWLQTRLLQGRCGDRLAADERRLEELDGLLGECHNCAILSDALQADSTLPRSDSARCLRLLRRYERALRGAARQLGAKVYEDTPAQYVERVRGLWRSARHDRRESRRGPSWRSAA
jgi:hypothetical protein